jgi:hypothetical protein
LSFDAWLIALSSPFFSDILRELCHRGNVSESFAMRFVCFVLASVLAVLAGTGAAQAQQTASPFFAFVLFGEGTDGRPVPMVRSVAERAMACPALRSSHGGAPVTMTPRRRPVGGQFDDVLVCEARYPVGEAASVFFGDRRIDLPVVSLGTPRRVVLVGDSGCRGDTKDKPQPCTGDGFANVWPFGTMADEEVANRPDLIVHVGDYNYRGTPRGMVVPTRVSGYARDMPVSFYDTGDLDDEDEPDLPIGAAYWSQNMEGSPIPDKWAFWRDDFFLPATRLLPVAPWLLSRGNHELCSRAGPGWFFLLDANSTLLGRERSSRSARRKRLRAGNSAPGRSRQRFHLPVRSFRPSPARRFASSSVSSTSSRSIQPTRPMPCSSTSIFILASIARSRACWPRIARRPGWSPIARSGVS